MGSYLGYIKLNDNPHVGGITYDEDNDILYITGKNGNIIAFDNRVINATLANGNYNKCLIDLSNIDDRTAEINNDISISCNISIEDLGKAASTYYYDGILYASTFNGRDNGKMRAFKINVKYENGKKIIDYDELYTTDIPPLVQGIAITEYKDKKYLLVTQSMGPIADGKILTYEFDENGNKKYLEFHYCQPGVEGISVD